MAKTPGCWANLLDNCNGPLTGEHLITAGVWEGVDGVENRVARVGRKIDFRGGPLHLNYTTTVDRLATKILCKYHNESSNDLDNEAIKFRKALVDYYKKLIERLGAAREEPWPPVEHTIDGPRMQRWLIKTAINCAQNFDKPIGGVGPNRGQPTLELVEQVFGRRPIDPQKMFAVARVGQDMPIEEERFTPMYFDRGGLFLAGCILGFRGLCLGVQFDDVPTSEFFEEPLEGFKGGKTLPRFPGLKGARGANVQVGFDWPALTPAPPEPV